MPRNQASLYTDPGTATWRCASLSRRHFSAPRSRRHRVALHADVHDAAESLFDVISARNRTLRDYSRPWDVMRAIQEDLLSPSRIRLFFRAFFFLFGSGFQLFYGR